MEQRFDPASALLATLTDLFDTRSEQGEHFRCPQ